MVGLLMLATTGYVMESFMGKTTFGWLLDQVLDVINVLAKYSDQNIKHYRDWNSITSNKQGGQDVSNVPSHASSYFLTFEGDGKMLLRDDLFQRANNLPVLKLCNCNFDFSSPPFNCCHNLRFLWLDHCTDTGKEQSGVPCFPDLLVLDIRYTDYDVLLPQMIELMNNLRELNTKGVSWRTISHAWKKFQNLHKLRVTGSTDVITMDSCSSIDMINLELLDMSGNTFMESLPEMSSARNLKVLVLDGCSSLEHIAPGEAPELLESFSFDGYGQAENWTYSIQQPKKELRPNSRSAPVEAKVTKISLEGCARLHSIFLCGLPNLEELDLSGTAIKTLDLTAMDVPQLKKLFLIGCKQLRRLFWFGIPKLNVSMLDKYYFTLICSTRVKSLHVYDNSSITIISTGSSWRQLKWCHIDKCPKLHTPFTCESRSGGDFANLTTVSASHLPMARCIWGRGINNQTGDIHISCFYSLQHIYMHNCPKLVFVLPISFTLPNLETLQISYCHNLQHVFPLDDTYPKEIASRGITFKNLKRIKLYHLHKLEQICEAKLTAPTLDTIILRDCWGLRRLPAVLSRQGPRPMVDCEKDLWDKLEWDGLEAGHDPLLFETLHSGYHKKTIPRGSLLR